MIMKKTYITPSVEEMQIALQCVIAASVSGGHEGFGTSSVDGGTEILSDPVDDVMGNILGL